MNAIAIALHGLAATVWVGGMFFAYFVLRPSLMLLEPHRRLNIWAGVFKRFFPWVWMSALILPITGYWLIFGAFGGFASSPIYVHIMHMVGLVMILLFVYLYYRPYVALKLAVTKEDWQAAGLALNRIRHMVLVNLVLGLLLLSIVYAGRYGLFG
jgi:uncharacterized membrane protein